MVMLLCCRIVVSDGVADGVSVVVVVVGGGDSVIVVVIVGLSRPITVVGRIS